MRIRDHVNAKSLGAAAAAFASLLISAPAAAALVTPVSVNLIASGGYTQGGVTVGTPISATESLTYANPVTSISPNIGPYLLTGETVELIGDSLHIRAYAGDDNAPGPNNLRTGLLGSGGTDKARYVWSGLDVAGRDITGFSISTLDISGPTAGVFSGLVAGTVFLAMTDSDADGSLDRLSFNLEDLRFVARPGATTVSQNFADITINFVSVPIGPEGTVPEPASIALCFAALAGLGLSARSRHKADRATAPRRD